MIFSQKIYMENQFLYFGNNIKRTRNAPMKCWAGYKKTGTQTIHGKTYNKCIRKPHAGGKRQK